MTAGFVLASSYSPRRLYTDHLLILDNDWHGHLDLFNFFLFSRDVTDPKFKRSRSLLLSHLSSFIHYLYKHVLRKAWSSIFISCTITEPWIYLKVLGVLMGCIHTNILVSIMPHFWHPTDVKMQLVTARAATFSAPLRLPSGNFQLSTLLQHWISHSTLRCHTGTTPLTMSSDLDTTKYLGT